MDGAEASAGSCHLFGEVPHQIVGFAAEASKRFSQSVEPFDSIVILRHVLCYRVYATQQQIPEPQNSSAPLDTGSHRKRSGFGQPSPFKSAVTCGGLSVFKT